MRTILADLECQLKRPSWGPASNVWELFAKQQKASRFFYSFSIFFFNFIFFFLYDLLRFLCLIFFFFFFFFLDLVQSLLMMLMMRSSVRSSRKTAKRWVWLLIDRLFQGSRRCKVVNFEKKRVDKGKVVVFIKTGNGNVVKQNGIVKDLLYPEDIKNLDLRYRCSTPSSNKHIEFHIHP